LVFRIANLSGALLIPMGIVLSLSDGPIWIVIVLGGAVGVRLAFTAIEVVPGECITVRSITSTKRFPAADHPLEVEIEVHTRHVLGTTIELRVLRIRRNGESWTRLWQAKTLLWGGRLMHGYAPADLDDLRDRLGSEAL
jgi:hypothetical protein